MNHRDYEMAQLDTWLRQYYEREREQREARQQPSYNPAACPLCDRTLGTCGH